MPKVLADISMSLDGFITGPNPGLANGLGDGGEALHTWAISSTDPVDADVLQRSTEVSGAVVMGRRLFDIVDGPDGWNDEMGYGARQAGTPPFFVLTHRAPDDIRLDLDFTFVTDGIDAAVEGAAKAAGDRDVVLMGGAEVIRQALDAGLVEELRIHLAPVLLGGGTPLFRASVGRRLVQRSVQVSTTATHLTYDLVG
jgi:dihydrofolate reductase